MAAGLMACSNPAKNVLIADGISDVDIQENTGDGGRGFLDGKEDVLLADSETGDGLFDLAGYDLPDGAGPLDGIAADAPDSGGADLADLDTELKDQTGDESGEDAGDAGPGMDGADTELDDAETADQLSDLGDAADLADGEIEEVEDATEVDEPDAECGDGVCQPLAGETCGTCPADCGVCPGCDDGECAGEPIENCATCPEDCGPCPTCSDGECVEEDGEDCTTCPVDCGLCPTVCGDGKCEQGEPWETAELCPGDCGACGDGLCGANEDEASCVHDCVPACGDGACDAGEEEGAEGHCPTDCGPCDDGICGYADFAEGCDAGDCVPGCGDGICDDAESAFNCPPDCGPPCGDGLCEPGETVSGCPVDCGICGDGVCGKWGNQPEPCPQDCSAPCGDGICWWGETPANCPLDCGPCGDGICAIGEQENGSCVLDCADCGDGECAEEESPFTCPADCEGCLPFCDAGWVCGPAGCGQLCGICPPGQVCVEHGCCTPDCEGKECGDDGCGGECGPCAPGLGCADATCMCSDDVGFEPNDLCTVATTLDTGVYNGLTVCPGGDEDWYLIEVEAGKTLQAEIVFENGDGDLDLYLHQASNCAGYLASSVSHSDNEKITYTSPGNSTYLLRVVALAPAMGNDYSLVLILGLPECGDGECHVEEDCISCAADCGACCVDCATWEECVAEVCVCSSDDGNEPNNLCTQTTSLEPGLYPDMGLCAGGDEDWYLVHADAEETLEISILFDNTLGNLELFLYPHGNCVGYIAKSTTLTDNEQIVHTTQFSSNFYVQVRGYGPAVGASYDLVVETFAPGCGDGVCGEAETCTTCPLDCGCECGHTCAAGECIYSACDDKECGEDGCGASCGECGPDEQCADGSCACAPATCPELGEDCGTWDDGCGGEVVCGPECQVGPFEVDLFLVLGQSNARGRGKGPSGIPGAPGATFEYDPAADQLATLAYPTGLPAGNYWTSDETSFVLAFGKAWFDLSGRIPVFVCRAKGGTALLESADVGKGDWIDVEDNDGLWDTAAAAYAAAQAHIDAHPDYLVAKKYVLWHQGESDANAAVAWDAYRDALAALLTHFDEEVGFDAFFISEIGHRLPFSEAFAAQSLEIIKGQQQVQEMVEKAVLVSKLPREFTAPCFDDEGDQACALWDDYHYDTWAYEALGGDMATNAWIYVLSGVKPFDPDL